MLKKAVWAVALLGVFAVVSLTSNTANAWGRRTVWAPQPVVWQPQPVMVVQQPVFVQQPVMVRQPAFRVAPRRVYRPVRVW